MNWKNFMSDYFHFTRRDRIGVLAIMTLVLGVFFLPDTLSKKNRPASRPADTAWVASLKRLEIREASSPRLPGTFRNDEHKAYEYDRYEKSYRNQSKGELFYFDPNTIAASAWQQLGLREKTIHTIQNYLAKGGHFKKSEDLQRIYGLFPDEYERIAPYIRIEPLGNPGEKNDNNNLSTNKTNSEPALKKVSPRFAAVEINTADSSAFIALPGIGSTLASRIIRFRDKLGGFYSVSQLSETFGLADSTFQLIRPYLKLEYLSVRKINVNKATPEELKAHPYIRYQLANSLIAYRKEHGDFTSPEDIRKLMVVTDEIYHKIAPYLTTQ